MKWRCAQCDQEHVGLPLDWAAILPQPIFDLDEAERAARCSIGPELCTMKDEDGEHYFMKGNVEVPIIDFDDHFCWTVWTSLSRQSFEIVQTSWDAEDRMQHEPMFGWLMTRIPFYPDTIALKTSVHLRAPGVRPLVELEPTDHPLAIEQREGMTTARVRELAEKLLHP